MTLKAGFIGLGAMGEPMAGHLARAGMLVVAGNRSTDKARRLAAHWGVRAAGTVADFAGCDVVALCVTADADVLQQAAALSGVLARGAVVVDHSTVAVDTARQAAALLATHGIGFVDAPVSGGVEGAIHGRLSVMAGAESSHLDIVAPCLACYAQRVTHMGEVGAGQATKAVNQVLVAGIAQAVCEGLALAEKLGLEAERLIPTLMAGAAGNWFLDKRGATLLRNEFSVGFKLSLLHKDLRIVQAMAEQAGIRHPVVDQALGDYATLMAAGHGDEDISALIRLKRTAGRE